MASQPLSTATESNRRIYDFLTQQFIGIVATSNLSAKPHAAVVYFSIDQNFVVTFITKIETQKHHNLTENNQVMFLVYDSFVQTTTQISGIAMRIDDKTKENDIYNNVVAIAQRTIRSEIPPIAKLLAGQYVAYEIKPIAISMAVYARPESGGEELFEAATLSDASILQHQ